MKKKVLLADFDSENIKSLTELLKEFEIDLEIVKNGEEALNRLREEDFDLLIVSAILPRINGFELTRRVRLELGLSSMPVFIISSIYKGSKYRYDAIHIYGATEFFELPLVEKDFLSKLREYLPVRQADETMRMETLNKEGEELEELEEVEEIEEVEELEEEEKLTSEEIFGDILAEVEGKPAEKKPEGREAPSEEKIDLEKLLEETLGEEEIKEEELPELLEEVEEVGEERTEEMPVVLEIETARKKEPEEKVLGDYVLLERISTGGMAEIYKAKKRGVEGFEKIVALKKILPHLAQDEEFITMFIDEAKLASKLTHPNIVQIYELGKINDSYFIAMEYVHGKDLRTIMKRLKKEGREFPIDLAAYIALKMCEALDYAHRKVGEDGKPLNIVHRDVSPQNILISYDGEIKLVDFGVAKASIRAHQTMAGSLKGKLLYMSPEQASGRKVDHRSDIFGLGTVLYEMVTGKKAFWAGSEAEVLEKVRKGHFEPPRKVNPAIPEELERIILKAMEPDVNRRYSSAADMRDELERFLLNYRGSIPNYREMAGFIRRLFAEEVDEELIPVEMEKPERKQPPPQEQPTKSIPQPPTEEKITTKSFFAGEKESRSLLPYILALLLVAAIVAAGYIFLKNRTSSSPPSTPPPTIQKTQPSPPPEQPSPQQKEQPQQQELQQEPPSEPVQPAVEQSQQSPPPAEAGQLSPVKKKRAKTAPAKPPSSAPSKKAGVKPPVLQQRKSPAVQTPPPLENKKPAPSVQEKKEAKQEKPKQVQPAAQEKPTSERQPSQQAPARSQPERVASPPRLKEGALVPLSQVDRKPATVSTVKPRVPPGPSKHGEVLLLVLIDENGRVEDAKVIRGIDERYNSAALKAVMKWRFSPALKNGIKVKVWYPIRVKF